MVRISSVPLKVCGFVPEAVWRRTADHPEKVNPHQSPPRVCLCVTLNEETASHLFIHCPTAYSMW